MPKYVYTIRQKPFDFISVETESMLDIDFQCVRVFFVFGSKNWRESQLRSASVKP